jgi:hypothetical protein
MNPTLKRFLNDRLHVGLVAAVLALLAFGSLMVWSATSTMTGHAAMVQRQLFGIGVGMLPLVFFWIFDYQVLKSWTGPLMFGLALLIISPRIPGLGSEVSGATSWLQIAGFRLFQPSEPAKLVFIVVLAAVIAEYAGKIDSPRDVLRVAGYVALPFVLIMLQPDLGTGLVFIMIAMGMLLVGGLKGRWFAAIALAGIIGVVGVWGANEVLNRTLHRGPYDPTYLAAVQAAGGDTSADSVQQVKDTSVLEALPDQPARRLHQPETGPTWRGLQPAAVQDRHRFGRAHGRRARGGYAEPPELHPGASHRLHLRGAGRAVRIRGCRGPAGLVPGALGGRAIDFGIQPRPLRRAHRSRSARHVAVPNPRECGHDHRCDAHHGYSIAVPELWFVLHGHEPGWCRYPLVGMVPTLRNGPLEPHWMEGGRSPCRDCRLTSVRSMTRARS